MKLWGSFRKPYQEIERIEHLLSDSTRFGVVSATLPATVRPDVLSRLGITGNDLQEQYLSNRVVLKMKYPANCFKDLDFLVQDTRSDSADHPDAPNTPDTPDASDTPDTPREPKHCSKFVIFFDDKNDTMATADYMRSRLPFDQRERIAWFMSDMSREFKDNGVEGLTARRIWRICSTDSFG